MQEAQTQPEAKAKCCGKCGSSHKHEANAAIANPLEILQQRFARGEIDNAEFEERRRIIMNA